MTAKNKDAELLIKNDEMPKYHHSPNRCSGIKRFLEHIWSIAFESSLLLVQKHFGVKIFIVCSTTEYFITATNFIANHFLSSSIYTHRIPKLMFDTNKFSSHHSKNVQHEYNGTRTHKWIILIIEHRVRCSLVTIGYHLSTFKCGLSILFRQFGQVVNNSHNKSFYVDEKRCMG